MKGRFSNSVALMKESFRVLRKNKDLVWFPIISAVISIIVLGSLFVPAYFLTGIKEGNAQSNYLYYVFLFIFYLVASFIVIFFNTGLVTCAQISLQGGDPSFSDGFNNAVKHIGKIFVWALISASVGMVLRMISERAGIIGRIIIGIIGLAWQLITFFVIPVMIFEEIGVVESIKESASLFKKTWGENVVTRFSFGLIFVLLGLVGVVPIVLVVFTKSGPLIVGIVAIVVVYWTVLAVISSSLMGILSTALYDYARTGQVPSAYSPELVQNAFGPKPARSLGRG